MGLVHIASVKQAEELRGVWNSFLDLSRNCPEESYYILPEKIEEGTRIFLGENQRFALFSGDKFVDCAVGPGAYVYLEVFACGEHTLMNKEHNQIIRNSNPRAFADGLVEGNVTGICFNLKESVRLPFTFDEALYQDRSCGLDIILQGAGYFDIQLANPLISYAMCGFNKEKLLTYHLPTFLEDDKKKLSLELEEAFESSLEELSGYIEYQKLPYFTKNVVIVLNKKLSNQWTLQHGIIVKDMEFLSCYPDEKSMLALVQYRRNVKNRH